MRLADFITANAEAILVEWEAFARSIWPGPATDPVTLRDHAVQMLHAAVEDMRSSQSAVEQYNKSKGKAGGAKAAQVQQASAEHGIGRVGSGFDLASVISEYRALRASVVRLWRESEPTTELSDLSDMTRFNEFIDQSLMEAVVAFSQHVEQERAAAFEKQSRQGDELRKLNNELLVSSVRQHELTEQAERGGEALRSSETRFRQLADSMPQMVWVTRPDGYHEYFNRRWYEFTGVPDGSTDGEGWHAMFHPEDQRRVWEAWQHSLSTGAPYEVEYRLRHNSGDYRWTLGRALPIRDGSGKIERWFGTCTDIAALKRLHGERETLLESERAAREEVERASIMKDQFLATLSHELRTPLTAILLWSRLLRRGAVKDATGQAHALEAIEVSAEAQKQLIEDLLDISGMTSGKLALSLQEVELEGIVHAAVEAIRPMAEAKGVELDLTLGRRSGAVLVDPDRIRQVVWNLLNNAVKFTESNGEVRVRVRRLRTAVQIQVQDTGRGISSDFLPYVFDRFRQQDASTTRTVGGLGLGLSISRQIVELHGGTIRVESDGPGKGATFAVELPLLSTVAFNDKDRSDKPAVVTLPPESSESLHGVRVLFVEDDRAARDAIQWVLKQAGAEVTAVESAAAAVVAFRMAQSAQRYDALISDIGLPERNGYQLIGDLREIEAQVDGKWPITPALALTAYARPEDREQAIAAGFQTHAAKPIEPAALLSLVASLVIRDSR